MNKFLLSLFIFSFAAGSVSAQQRQLPKVVDREGNLVDMPAFKSPEARNIVPRRCGTSMLLAKQTSGNDGKRKAIDTQYSYVTHTGTVTIPVILVNFKDVKLSVNNPQKAFDEFFNATGDIQALGNGNQYNHGSVAKYFSDMSGGAYNLKFIVYSPVTLDQNESYYGGSNDDSNSDEKPRELVRDAVNALSKSKQITNSDIASFTGSGGTLDCVYIIYAGCGQNNGGDASTVWANTWVPYDNTALSGKRIRWYSMASELSPYKVNSSGSFSQSGSTPMIAGVGVTCHELSHALGLPDFYPTSESAYLDNQEMEYWDLMDGGEYGGSGFSPIPYTAFEKNEMGWQVDIQTLTENTTVSIANSTEKGGTAYKIVNPDNDNEYFMLECMQERGWYGDSSLGNGLLVYHVNRPDALLSSNQYFNNTPNYPGMAVVPADGLCASSYVHSDSSYPYYEQLQGDLFPGTGNLTPDTLDIAELSDAKPKPNFCWYNSSKTQKLPTNKALQNITYDTSTGVVSFSYIHDITSGIKTVNLGRQDTDNRIYTINGIYVGTDLQSLPSGIYIVNKHKVIK